MKMMNRLAQGVVVWGLVLSCGLASNPATAQGASGGSAVLEEVTVTARRRVETLQEVPVAVQTFSAEELANAGIKDFREIVSRTPGMVLSAGNGADHEIFIRGIGTDIQGAAVDNPVGIFVDGVYMSRNSGSHIGLFDLERVEVLKGPQSLRFGKNIVGGLIHYVSKKPADEFEGSAEITYGDHDHIDIGAAARGPINDSVAYAISGVSNVHSGYGINTRGEDAEDQNRSAVRGHLRFDASDNTSVLLSADYNRTRGTGRWTDIAFPGDSEAVTFNGFFAPPIPQLPGFVLPTRNAPFDDASPRRGARNTVGNIEADIYGTSARIEWAGDNGMSLVSITAYREAGISNIEEGCGIFWNYPFEQASGGLGIPDPASGIVGSVDTYLATVPDCWFLQQRVDDVKQFSQELRLSGGSDRVQWSAGLYYLDEDIERHENVAFSFPDFNVITDWAFSLAFGGAPSGLVETAGVSKARTGSSADNVGVFGEVTFDLSDHWSLNAGVRWVSDDKDFTVTRSGQTFDEPICEPDDMGVLPAGCTVAGFFTTEDSASWDEVLPSISLTYRGSDTTNYYARFEQGYKPGGYTGEGAGQPSSALVSFDPEFSNAFEIGAKLLLADRRIRLNIAAHFTEYEDLQTQQFIAADPTRPPDNFVVNATNGTEAYGVEIDFQAAVSESLTMFANYAFTECEFAGELEIEEGIDVDGNTCRRTPRHGFNIGADYAVPVNDQYEFRLGGDYNWKDEFFFDNTNTDVSLVDSEYVLNLRAGVGSLDNEWDLQFWVKNVTDELNTANTFEIFGTVYLNYNPPRTYGVTYRRNF